MLCRTRLGLTLVLTLGLFILTGPVSAQSLKFLDRFTWSSPNPDAIGFSGLILRDNGADFLTVSDKGNIASGLLVRRGGRIVGVADVHITPLLDPDGAPVRRYDIDAEGMAQGPDGSFFVSFEANHRVWQYASATSAAHPLPKAAGFADFQNNSGMEALVTDEKGRILTLPERSGELERPFPVYRYDGARWSQPFEVPRRGTFLPVGADLGPDGWYYLLERDFVWYKGFATRIRRFHLSEGGVSDEQTLLETPFGLHDNLEGISTWRNEAGDVVLTMISDDNDNILQRTEFVEYRVVESAQTDAGTGETGGAAAQD